MAGGILALVEEEMLKNGGMVRDNGNSSGSTKSGNSRATRGLQEFGMDETSIEDSTNNDAQFEHQQPFEQSRKSPAISCSELLMLNFFSALSVGLIVYSACFFPSPNWHDKFAFKNVLIYPVVGACLFIFV